MATSFFKDNEKLTRASNYAAWKLILDTNLDGEDVIEFFFSNSIYVYIFIYWTHRFFPDFSPIRLKLFALLPRQFIADSESGNIAFESFLNRDSPVQSRVERAIWPVPPLNKEKICRNFWMGIGSPLISLPH